MSVNLMCLFVFGVGGDDSVVDAFRKDLGAYLRVFNLHGVHLTIF